MNDNNFPRRQSWRTWAQRRIRTLCILIEILREELDDVRAQNAELRERNGVLRDTAARRKEARERAERERDWLREENDKLYAEIDKLAPVIEVIHTSYKNVFGNTWDRLWYAETGLPYKVRVPLPQPYWRDARDSGFVLWEYLRQCEEDGFPVTQTIRKVRESDFIGS